LRGDVLGVFAQKVDAWSGAPQSIYSDHCLQTQVLPMQPRLVNLLAQGLVTRRA